MWDKKRTFEFKVRLFQQKAKTNTKRCDMNFIRCWTRQQGKHCNAVWNSPFASFSSSWKGNLYNSVAFLNVKMRPTSFKCPVARLLARDYNSHKSWSSYCVCNATRVHCQSEQWIEIFVHVYHSQIIGLFMITLHEQENHSKEGTQSNRTNNAFNKLQCLIIVR